MKLIVIALALFIFLKGPEYYYKHIEIPKQQKTSKNIHKLFGDDIFETYNIKFPNVVRAQIILETEWLRSTIYKENHNLFGMKESCTRDWDCGSNRKHAKYKDVGYSLADYAEWQAMRFNQATKRGMKIPQTDEEYLYFLQHLPNGGAYAEDPLYVNKLRYIMSL